ncbi:WKF domain-containing protein [Plasmodiophora brassicae]|uniref:WKF domain-containing protein n=1 Tax=Plasmodiophora brassicae TaxID=37360 RepID=A0A0G4IIL3_PLABS|nr:hypothetical protein PBRA_003837 [Plasmodiophora brassicae]SPQ94352.1 unnamed protein product [Plasmodiophora brassicae]
MGKSKKKATPAEMRAKVKAVVERQKKRKQELKAARVVKGIAKQEALDKERAAKSLDDALQYLTLWDTNRSEWKFHKKRQITLLKNMLDRTRVPKPQFKILLRYLGGLGGVARVTTIAEMKAEMARSPDDNCDAKTLGRRQKRASCIVECLSARSS